VDEGAELAGQGVDATASAAAKAANAVSNTVKGTVDVKSIQPALQQGIRNTLAAVAKDVGVEVPTSASSRVVTSSLKPNQNNQVHKKPLVHCRQ
jgi:hypothetical protein